MAVWALLNNSSLFSVQVDRHMLFSCWHLTGLGYSTWQGMNEMYIYSIRHDQVKMLLPAAGVVYDSDGRLKSLAPSSLTAATLKRYVQKGRREISRWWISAGTRFSSFQLPFFEGRSSRLSITNSTGAERETRQASHPNTICSWIRFHSLKRCALIGSENRTSLRNHCHRSVF